MPYTSQPSPISYAEAEHVAFTRTLVERIFRMSAWLVAFLNGFTNHASRHVASGQKEMCNLLLRLSELQNYVQQ